MAKCASSRAKRRRYLHLEQVTLSSPPVDSKHPQALTESRKESRRCRRMVVTGRLPPCTKAWRGRAWAIAVSHWLADRKNVFRCWPTPQSLNDPKSLYHAPIGTCGDVSIHSWSSRRSAMLISRSFIRVIKCSRMAIGRSGHLARFGIIRRKSCGPFPHQAVRPPSDPWQPGTW